MNEMGQLAAPGARLEARVGSLGMLGQPQHRRRGGRHRRELGLGGRRLGEDGPAVDPHVLVGFTGGRQVTREAQVLVGPLEDLEGDALGLSVSDVGILVAIGAFSELFLFPVSGFLMDRFGRPAAIIPFLLLFGGGLLLAAAASSPLALTVAAGCSDDECSDDKDCGPTKVCKGTPKKCVFPKFGWGNESAPSVTENDPSVSRVTVVPSVPYVRRLRLRAASSSPRS